MKGTSSTVLVQAQTSMDNASTLVLREVPIDEITIGTRHRKDLGDLNALANSIATEGLLQPIGITEDNVLVFGERRLLAMRDVLSKTAITATVVHVSSIVAGEYAENEVRKDFTASERVAIANALSAEIGERRGRDNVGNCAQFKGQKTRDIVAQKAGFETSTTYERARKVVENAVDEVIAQMDSEQLSISAAALIAEQAPDAQRHIANLPPEEQREEVRKLRRCDLPTPAEAHQRAKDTNMAVLDRNHQWQTPMPMHERKPLIELNHTMVAIVEAAGVMASCNFSAAQIAGSIREFNTPDMDFVGKLREAEQFLWLVNEELKNYGK